MYVFWLWSYADFIKWVMELSFSIPWNSFVTEIMYVLLEGAIDVIWKVKNKVSRENMEKYLCDPLVGKDFFYTGHSKC